MFADETPGSAIPAEEQNQTKRNLKRKLENDDGSKLHRQVIVPKKHVLEVIRELQNGSSGGDMSIKKFLVKEDVMNVLPVKDLSLNFMRKYKG